MLYLGIDQHRKQVTVNVRDEEGHVVIARQVSTQWERIRAFFAQLRERAEAAGGFIAIVEVCGFNDWLIGLLKEYGCHDIALVQTAARSRKKTDRRDAAILAELLWINRQRLAHGEKLQHLRRVTIPSPQDAQDRQLTALRKRLGECRTRTLNKIQRILLRHNLQQECPTKGLQTHLAATWLKQLKLNEGDRLELDFLLAQWKLWDEQIDDVDKRICQRFPKSLEARLISSIPGARDYTALALASRVAGIQRFPRPSSLGNYWGVTPGCRNSGDATQRLGSITKEGSAIARFLLGQLVLHVLRKDRQMKDWYRRIKHRRGAKIARVAVMRRLTTILWHMLPTKQTYWQLRDAAKSRRTPRGVAGTFESPPRDASRLSSIES